MSIKDLVPRFGRKEERMPIRRREEEGLLSFQREMNRLFDNFFSGFELAPGPFGSGKDSMSKSVFSPSVDVAETDGEVKVSAELAGMDEKDVTVELGEDMITICGEKREEREDAGKNWYRREMSYGSFHRAIPLPAKVDGEKAKAKFKRGKLTVTMPKKKESAAKRRSIPIS